MEKGDDLGSTGIQDGSLQRLLDVFSAADKHHSDVDRIGEGGNSILINGNELWSRLGNWAHNLLRRETLDTSNTQPDHSEDRRETLNIHTQRSRDKGHT